MTEQEKLKQYMSERGLSVNDLARILDLKPAYIRQVLKPGNKGKFPSWAKALIYG